MPPQMHSFQEQDYSIALRTCNYHFGLSFNVISMNIIINNRHRFRYTLRIPEY